MFRHNCFLYFINQDDSTSWYISLLALHVAKAGGKGVSTVLQDLAGVPQQYYMSWDPPHTLALIGSLAWYLQVQVRLLLELIL